MSLAQTSGKSKRPSSTNAKPQADATEAKTAGKATKSPVAVALKAAVGARKSEAASKIVSPSRATATAKPAGAGNTDAGGTGAKADTKVSSFKPAKTGEAKAAVASDTKSKIAAAAADLKAKTAVASSAAKATVKAVSKPAPGADPGAAPAKKSIVSTASRAEATMPVAAPTALVAVPMPAAAATDAKAPSPVRKVEKAAKPAASAKRNGFSTLEYIVYPAHGVGQIVAVEEQEVAGFKLELFVISFSKDKMILKVPVPKVASVGMRKLAEEPVVKRSLDTLMGRARIKRTMWSRRAQEYEAKINSGDLIAIAEVVRDLYRSEAQPEQSYSERQLYEAALDRIAREIGTVLQLTETEALKLIETNLQKGPRRTRVDDAEADSDDAGGDEEAA